MVYMTFIMYRNIQNKSKKVKIVNILYVLKNAQLNKILQSIVFNSNGKHSKNVQVKKMFVKQLIFFRK